MDHNVRLMSVVFVALGAFLAQAESSHRGWDAKHSLFYNTDRFAQGVIDDQGHSLISDTQRAACLCAWDLHGVILKPNTWVPFTMAKIGAITKERGISYFLGLLKDYYYAAQELQREQKARNIESSYRLSAMYHFFAEHQFEKECEVEHAHLKNLHALYARYPYLDERVAALIKKLTQKGIEHVVCSNMNGAEAAKIGAVCARIAAEAPSRKCYGHAARLLAHSNNFFTSTQNHLVGKPHQQVYQEFLQNNPGPYAVRIFIDDRRENVEAAVTCGFDIGILCRSPKQLNRTLKKLGFFKRAAPSQNS